MYDFVRTIDPVPTGTCTNLVVTTFWKNGSITIAKIVTMDPRDARRLFENRTGKQVLHN